MVTIDIILNKLTQFFSWLYSTLGLPRWLLLTVTLVVLAVLIFIAKKQRKTKLKFNKIHTINTGSRPEIIGTRLTAHKSSATKIEDGKENELAFDSETGEKHRSWGRTIEEWRKATEQSRKLKYASARLKKTEEQQHGQQSAESNSTQNQPPYEISEHKQSNELTESKKQIAYEINKSEPTTENIEPQLALPIMIKEQTQHNLSPVDKTDDRPRENTKEAQKYKNNDVPLDVKELKTVAELAKRLRRNNRQQQIK